MKIRTLLIAASLSLAACNGLNFDVDGVALADMGLDGSVSDSGDGRDDGLPPDAERPDQGRDMNLTDDGVPDDMRLPDVGSDMTADMADIGSTDAADAADMSPLACELPHPIDESRCNPLIAGVCPTNGMCDVVFINGGLRLACVDETNRGPGMVGDACVGPRDCAEHLSCFNWSALEPDPRGRVCSQFCNLETNEGCGPDEFCTGTPAVPEVEGFGWCTSRCDPYDADSCPAGQTCTIDYNFPSATCQPEFRCLEVGTPGAAGAACGSGSAVADCAHGLTCYEVAITDYRCVEPCTNDSDCAATCGQPAGPWALRYCQ